MHRNEWKHNNPKPIGHCKSSTKGKVHSNTGLPQETREKSNNLTLHLKQLETKEIMNPRVSRRKEVLKIRAEINAKETKGTIAKISKAKSCFFERRNKIDKPLARLTIWDPVFGDIILFSAGCQSLLTYPLCFGWSFWNLKHSPFKSCFKCLQFFKMYIFFPLGLQYKVWPWNGYRLGLHTFYWILYPFVCLFFLSYGCLIYTTSNIFFFSD